MGVGSHADALEARGLRPIEGGTFEVRLLGDLTVLADGRTLDLGGPRQRILFALLVLQRNRPLATELLSDRLWPDEQPLGSHKAVQVYVSRLRHALGDHAARLVSSTTGYRLAVADDELDAARFERGVRRAREALAAGAPEISAELFEKSLAIWSGPALNDLAGEGFARREAERLEELRIQASEELLALRIESGQEREAIVELRRILGDHPGRERVWRLLMLALYADGRQGEALQVYQDARRYLADELGLDPSQEMRELEHAILTQELVRPISSPLLPGPRLAGEDASADAGVVSLGPAPRRTRRIVTLLRAEMVRPTDAEMDPEQLELLDRRSVEMVAHAVERHGGTIDRVDHEGVTAVFGLVVAREDDAVRAIRAASELSPREPSPGATSHIVFRVGVATGEVLASMHERQGSSLTGLPTELAARLAARAQPEEVLLTIETDWLVRGAASTERVVPVDGRDEPPCTRLLAVSDRDAVVRRTTTPFVGRVHELGRVVAAFDRVASTGTPGAVTVIGVPGVGKSRLVAEALARIGERARVLRSRCLPYGDGITYRPIRELVLAAAGITPGAPRDEALARLESVLAESDRRDLVLRALAYVSGLADGPAGSEEIPWAVRRFFEAAEAGRPLVLLVDDIQWAEPLLLDVLEHLLDLGRGPILLVTVARPELEETRPGWLARMGSESVRLDPLDDVEGAQLLDLLAPDLHAGPLRSGILAAAEGNPLFVEQFVAYLSDEHGVYGRRLEERTRGGLPIPPTIGALLAARLDRLPDAERRLLERAAVIGRTFSVAALDDLLPEDERAALLPHLGRLARRDLIRPDLSGTDHDEAYRFRHLLIRDAAYRSLPKRERAVLHERVADWLQGRPGAMVSAESLIVAYHLEQAWRYRRSLDAGAPDLRRLADRALAILGPAGLAAEERGDAHAALSLLRRAVDLAPPGRERIELLIALRSALETAGEPAASEAADAETVSLLAEYPDEGLEHRRWLSRAVYHAGLESGAGTQAAYAYYESVGDRMGMIRALEVAFMHSDPTADAVELADRAISLAFEIGRPDRAATLAARSSWLLPGGPIPVMDGLARLRRHLDWAEPDSFARAMILLHVGQLEAMSGVRDRWRRRFDEAKAIIDELGLLFPMGIFGYPAFLGEAELIAGEPARVVEILQQSCLALDRRGDLARLASVAPQTAQMLLAVGRLDEVEHYALWGRDIAGTDDWDAQGRWRMAMSGLRSSQGRHGEAIALAREATALLADTELVVLQEQVTMSLAEACRAAGDEPGALSAAREARRLAAAKQNQAALRKIQAFLHG